MMIHLFDHHSATAQVLNVDREANTDSIQKNWEIVSGISFSADRQKKNIVDLNSNFELVRNLNNSYSILGLARNDAVISGKSILQNEGMMHLRYQDLNKRKWSIETFAQYQWNGAWGMEYRYLGGLNLRLKWINNKKINFYSGLGVFHEWEKWNWSGVSENLIPLNATKQLRNLNRLNNYSKFSAKLSALIDLTLINYLQFPLNKNLMSPRWYVEMNSYFIVSKHLNFVIRWDHIYDKNTLVPIDDFYYSYSTGLQYKL
jgi:hypothetical protein